MDQLLKKLTTENSIVIGHTLDIPKDVTTNYVFSTILIITDTNLEAMSHFDRLKQAFEQDLNSRSRLLTLVISPGEASKSRSTKAFIEDFLLEHQCDRETCLIAFGGGVIGDLVGFVASTYLRGVTLIHIPTTLLSMVDSSIGGKNGIDTKHGKNLIGTFYEARRNYINLSYLETLPRREFYNGMAEIIKMAATGNKAEFEQLLKNEIKPDSLEPENLLHVVTTAIQYKTFVVSQDGKDAGLRQLLNFGHTIGHGIESAFSPHLLHGECVAIGMILETKIAIRLGYCTEESIECLQRALLKYQLPVSLAKVFLEVQDKMVFPSVEQMIRIIGVDKKNSGGAIRLVLLSEIGKTVEPRATAVPTPEIEKVLHEEYDAFIFENYDRLLGSPRNSRHHLPEPGPAGSKSFFVCLTMPDLGPIAHKFPIVTKGVHAIELRVDLLQHPPDFKFVSNQGFQDFLEFIASQVEIIRKHVPELPIIYTPRTCSEGGQIPDDTPSHLLKSIFMLGFYLGCELVDIQMNLPHHIITSLTNLKKVSTSKVIASYHQMNEPLDWSGPECRTYVEKGQTFGDIIKLVSVAVSEQDNKKLEEFADDYWANDWISSRTPLIAVNVGELGQVTRVRNRYLTPVTHEDLPAAAPGPVSPCPIPHKTPQPNYEYELDWKALRLISELLHFPLTTQRKDPIVL